MFDSINLERELLKIRKNNPQEDLDSVLEAFKDLFRADWETEKRISQTLHNGSPNQHIPGSDMLNPDQIFELSDIRKLCIKYRLRFLPTKYFNSSFPIEAINAVKKIEKELNVEISNFMIVAPSKLFKLEDANSDPLLFIPLKNNKFYLVHQWGNDLSWHRRVLTWPLKSFAKLATTIGVFSIVATVVMPNSIISHSESFFSFGRTFFFIWCLLTLSALVSYLWFMFNQKFSEDAWNCKNFN